MKLSVFFMFYIISESESVQSGQPSVERDVHHESVRQCFSNPGGGAVVQRRTKDRGVLGDVSLCRSILQSNVYSVIMNIISIK